jgi:membrane protease subunit HflC
LHRPSPLFGARPGNCRNQDFLPLTGVNKIQSEAYRQVEEIRGMADAKATEIYAGAYNQSPEAVAFYEFTRTMQSYKSIIAENTTLVLSTGSDLFKFLKGMSPDGDVVPAPHSDGNR